jgi:hypothetical protein
LVKIYRSEKERQASNKKRARKVNKQTKQTTRKPHVLGLEDALTFKPHVLAQKREKNAKRWKSMLDLHYPKAHTWEEEVVPLLLIQL